MLNLIRKDIVLQKNILIIMLPLLFVSLFLSTSAIWFGFIFCFAIIMQSFSMDEKTSIHLLLNSLPYTRKEIVSSKYLSACIIIFLVLMTIFIGNLIIHREIMQWEQLLIIASMVLVSISFTFPFSYLFNSQYLLFAFGGVLFVLYLIIISLFIPNLNDIIRDITQMVLSLKNYWVYLLVIAAVVFLYISSWMLSIRIYSRKVF